MLGAGVQIYLLNIQELIQDVTYGGKLMEQALDKVDAARREKTLKRRTPEAGAASLGAGLLLQRAVRDWQNDSKKNESAEEDTEKHKLVQGECSGAGQKLVQGECPGAGQKLVQEKCPGEKSEFVLREYSVEELLSQKGVPIDLSYRYGGYGKPYFQDLPLYFSLSHSGDYVLCAVSEEEIGADIQRMCFCGSGGNKNISNDSKENESRTAQEREKRLGEQACKLARRFFAEAEYRALESCQDEAERLRLFFELWARKEAFGKLTGQGIVPVLGRVGQACVAAEAGFASEAGFGVEKSFTEQDKGTSGATPEKVQWLKITAPEGYAAAVCVKNTRKNIQE